MMTIEDNSQLALSDALVWLHEGIVLTSDQSKSSFKAPCWIYLPPDSHLFSLERAKVYFLDNLSDTLENVSDYASLVLLRDYFPVINYCLNWKSFGLSSRYISALIKRLRVQHLSDSTLDGVLFHLQQRNNKNHLSVQSVMASESPPLVHERALFLPCEPTHPGLFESLIFNLHLPGQKQSSPKEEIAIIPNHVEGITPSILTSAHGWSFLNAPVLVFGYFLMTISTIIIYLFQARMQRSSWVLNDLFLVVIISFFLTYIAFRFYHFNYVLNYYFKLFRNFSVSSIKNSIRLLMIEKLTVDEAVAKIRSFQHFGKSYFGHRDLVYPVWVLGFFVSQLLLLSMLKGKASVLLSLNFLLFLVSMFLFKKIVSSFSKAKMAKKKIDVEMNDRFPNDLILKEWFFSKKIAARWENIFFSFQNNMMIFGNVFFLFFVIYSLKGKADLNLIIAEQFTLLALVNLTKRLNFLGNFLVEFKDLKLKEEISPAKIDLSLSLKEADKITIIWTKDHYTSKLEIQKKQNFYLMSQDLKETTDLLKCFSGTASSFDFSAYFHQTKLSVEELLPMVGFFSSDLRLLKMSVRENIYMKESPPKEAVDQVFKILNLSSLMEDEKLTLDQMVGPDFQLSTKLIRHILLARTLLAPHRDLCILSGIGDWMDPETWKALLDWAKSQGKIILSAGSSFGLAESMDEVVFLNDSRICDRGPLTSLLMEGGPIKQCWQDYYGV
jgi:hypothetical protein